MGLYSKGTRSKGVTKAFQKQYQDNTVQRCTRNTNRGRGRLNAMARNRRPCFVRGDQHDVTTLRVRSRVVPRAAETFTQPPPRLLFFRAVSRVY